jgi:hypothetical protein
MTGGHQAAAIGGGITGPPPGWARWSDRILARLFARSIDEKLLSAAASNGSPAIIVRRARLLSRRYRSKVADALRKLIEAARRRDRNPFVARIPLREEDVLDSEPLILTLADELEREETVNPRGVILAERLVTDGGSPVYWSSPVERRKVESVESAVRHARVALHLG